MSKDQPTQNQIDCQEDFDRSRQEVLDGARKINCPAIEPGAGTALDPHFKLAQEQAERDWREIEARSRKTDWAAVARGESKADFCDEIARAVGERIDPTTGIGSVTVDIAREKIVLRHHVELTGNVAENVKARCYALDFSPIVSCGLADRMGASPGLVRKILSGQGQIRHGTADRLLAALDVDLWQYLRESPDKFAERGLANPKSLSLLSRVKIIAKKFLTWARAMILWG